MPTPRRRSADTPRRGRRTTERDQPYSQETQEALEAFIGELAVMPPPVVLIFHGLLNGRSLDEIAATLHTTQSQALALIDKARREHPMVADAYGANGHALDAKAETGEAATEGETGNA